MKSGIIRYYTTPNYYINVSPELLKLISDTLDTYLFNKFIFSKKDTHELDFYLNVETESDEINTREIFKKQSNKHIFSVEIKLPYHKVVKNNQTDIPALIRYFIQGVSTVLKPYLSADMEVFSEIINLLVMQTGNSDKYNYTPNNSEADLLRIVAEVTEQYNTQNKFDDTLAE